ncbi:reticulocyte-binding protein 2-like [Parasteatoda tepidariorum]|uniref:reticulocyte-binding protein 2-like n=1 Tax=Parasteatoda tepidariorum TaxID=114398 RepID=UPI0039BC76E2
MEKEKLNRSKRAVKGTITKLETYIDQTKEHNHTELEVKLKRVEQLYKKVDELKEHYYGLKDITDPEVTEVETDLEGTVDRLEALERHCWATLKRLETLDDSFESLLKALENRFENKRLLTETYINQILEIEKLTNESAGDIRNMVDILKKNIRALKLLNFDRNNLSDILLLNIILKKVDRETRKQYEQTTVSNEIPELDKFLEFLEKRSQSLDSISRTASSSIYKHKQAVNKSKSFLNSNNNPNSCVICKLPHMIFKCNTFQNMKVSDRFNEMKRLNLCINCLKNNHKVKDWKSNNSCFVCKKRHNTLLHIYEISSPPSTSSVSTMPGADQTTVSQLHDSFPQEHSNTFSNYLVSKKIQNILLPTAVVYIRNELGDYYPCRAILDSASHLSFCEQKLANDLMLKKEKINASVSGLSDISVNIKHKVTTVIKNNSGSFSTSLELLIVPSITNLTIINPVEVSNIRIPPDINLADPEFNSQKEVELIIGCELFFEILKPNQFRSACSNWLF